MVEAAAMKAAMKADRALLAHRDAQRAAHHGGVGVVEPDISEKNMLNTATTWLSPPLRWPTMVSDRVITRCTTLASSSAADSRKNGMAAAAPRNPRRRTLLHDRGERSRREGGADHHPPAVNEKPRHGR